LAFAGDSTITSFVPRRIGGRAAATSPVAVVRLLAVVARRGVVFVAAFAAVPVLRAVVLVVVRALDFAFVVPEAGFVAAVRRVGRRDAVVVASRSLVSFSDISPIL
jgi:hypothetical protein